MTGILSDINALTVGSENFSIVVVTVRILLATLLGGIIGMERSRHGRDAGLRTHIFICLGSAMTALIGIYCHDILGYNLDPLRISAQVVSGIGFLGAGTILVKNSSKVTGLTTAAGMWATAAIGIATGVGFYEAAVLCAILCVLTAALFTRLEAKHKGNHQFYIEIDNAAETNRIIDEIKTISIDKIEVITLAPRSGTQGNIGLVATIPLTKTDKQTVISNILKLNNVVLVVED